MAERLVMQRGALPDWSGDWQDTQEFRDEVSTYLLEFLSLGASGTTGNAWYNTAADTGGWRYLFHRSWHLIGYSGGNSPGGSCDGC